MDAKRKRFLWACVLFLILITAFRLYIYDLNKEIGWWKSEEKLMRVEIVKLKSENSNLRYALDEARKEIYNLKAENSDLKRSTKYKK